MSAFNPNCQCPQKACPNHGNCRACTEAHNKKGMYCQIPAWKKKIKQLLIKFHD